MSPQIAQMLCELLVFAAAVLGGLGVLGRFHFKQLADAHNSRKSAQAGKLDVEPVISQSSPVNRFPRSTLGDSAAGLTLVDTKPVKAFQIFNETSFTVERINDKIALSVELFDPAGDMIARLERNEWKINPSKVFDRNYSDDAIEILGPDGKVAVQAKLVSDGVQLQFKLYGPSGECAAFWKQDDPVHPGAMSLAYDEESRKQIPDIEPMFKYPSELHVGELVAD